MVQGKTFTIYKSIVVVLLALGGTCVPRNVSVDDAFTDPNSGVSQFVYGPPTSNLNVTWNPGPCTGCSAQPDPSMAFNGTWHDVTYFADPKSQVPTASITFTGTAVYVIAITAPFFPFGAGNTIQTTGTDMTFLLDGDIVGSFLQKTVSGCCAEYQYNVPVYVNESLPNTQHTLTVETGVRGSKVITLLDQIIYTTDNELDKPATDSISNINESSTVSSGPSNINNMNSLSTGTSSGFSAEAATMSPQGTTHVSQSSSTFQTHHSNLSAATLAGICISVLSIFLVVVITMWKARRIKQMRIEDARRASPLEFLRDHVQASRLEGQIVAAALSLTCADPDVDPPAYSLVANGLDIVSLEESRRSAVLGQGLSQTRTSSGYPGTRREQTDLGQAGRKQTHAHAPESDVTVENVFVRKARWPAL